MTSLDPKYKKEFWTMPEGYFDHLEDRVIEQIKPASIQSKKVVSMHSIFAVAASVCIVVLITVLSIRSVSEDNEISFNDLDSMDIVQFERNVEFDDEEFESFVQEEVIDSLYTERIESKYISSFISKEELEDLEEEYTILDDEIDI